MTGRFCSSCPLPSRMIVSWDLRGRAEARRAVDISRAIHGPWKQALVTGCAAYILLPARQTRWARLLPPVSASWRARTANNIEWKMRRFRYLNLSEELRRLGLKWMQVGFVPVHCQRPFLPSPATATFLHGICICASETRHTIFVLFSMRPC